MHFSLKSLIVAAAAVVATAAGAQTTNDNRSAGQATRDTANAAGRAASAAVTPGDQNMGRTPQNRSGGLMGNDRNNTDTSNTTGTGTGATGSTSDNTTGTGRRAARADRG